MPLMLLDKISMLLDVILQYYQKTRDMHIFAEQIIHALLKTCSFVTES